MIDRPSRMLPRMFNPVQLKVDCSAKTPSKAAEGKKPKRGKVAKAAAEQGSVVEGSYMRDFLLSCSRS